MITVDEIWIDKCIIQIDHTFIAKNFAGFYKNSYPPCNFPWDIINMHFPIKLVINMHSQELARCGFRDGVNTMYMVFFILSDNLLTLSHCEILASSWLSVACKENMSLPWSKRLVSSANSIGKDEGLKDLLKLLKYMQTRLRHNAGCNSLGTN